MDLAAELARMRAETDQGIEASKELSRSIYAFYAGLVEAGFSDDQALALTQTWLSKAIETSPAQQIAEWFKGLGEES